LPVYNPDPDFLEQVLKSVLVQTYHHWELCIADDASTNPSITKTLNKYAAKDSRIKICLRSVNGHISLASNSALEMATGGWVVLLDHDDILPPNALEEVAKVIRESPEVSLIYSDEDKIDQHGKRFGPYFKSDWNRDLLLSQNVFCHLMAIRRSLVKNVGGFRVGYEGAQDHDLALRVIEQIRDNQIHHIPKILYHWRSHSESTASTGDAKPYTVTAGERSINDHLQRIGSRGTYTHDGAGGYRVRYPMPERRVVVSAIIISNGNIKNLQRSIDQIKKAPVSIGWEFCVLPSTPKVGRLLRTAGLPSDILLEERRKEETSSVFLNRVTRNASGELLWYLHKQVGELDEGGVEEMVSHALRSEIGAVGGKQFYPDGRIRQAGLLLDLERISRPSFHHWNGDSRGYMGRLTLIQNYSAVSKDCLMIVKKKFLEVGGFDEGHLRSHHLDVDLCLRLKEAGYRTLWTPYAKFCDSRPRFSLSGIMNQFSHAFRQDTAYMKGRWGEILENDPAYNPNLNQKKKDFNYQWPPRENG
jgi:GT2 family glycosyltransferase